VLVVVLENGNGICLVAELGMVRERCCGGSIGSGRDSAMLRWMQI